MDDAPPALALVGGIGAGSDAATHFVLRNSIYNSVFQALASLRPEH
jgi:hypothetical protein